MYNKNNISWTGLDHEWRERLKDVFWSNNTNTDLKFLMPEKDLTIFNNLKKTLLDFAGEEVCLPFFNPECKITENFSKKAVYCSKENIEASVYLPSNGCHTNAAYLVAVVDPSLDLYNGYYMDESGMWREHSWCVNPKTGVIIEPTNAGHCYFGVNLSEWDNQEEIFIECNLNEYDINDINEHLHNLNEEE